MRRAAAAKRLTRIQNGKSMMELNPFPVPILFHFLPGSTSIYIIYTA